MTTTIVLGGRAPTVAPPILRIASVEAARLVRHPAFVVGLLLTLLHAAAEPLADEEWAGQGYFMAMTGWVWVWAGTLVAAACVAGRDRWVGDPDLFPGTPVTASGRVTGAAVALAGPVAVTAVAATAMAIWFDHRGGFSLGDPPYTESINLPVAQWVQGPVLVAVAGMAGIALTQLRRARMVALVALTAITWVCGIAPWLFAGHPFRVLHPFMYPAYEQSLPGGVTPAAWIPGDPPLLRPSEYAGWREVRFDTAALWWHLGYVAGIAMLLLWASTRLADGEMPRRTVKVVGVLVVGVCGTLMVLTAGHGSIDGG